MPDPRATRGFDFETNAENQQYGGAQNRQRDHVATTGTNLTLLLEVELPHHPLSTNRQQGNTT